MPPSPAHPLLPTCPHGVQSVPVASTMHQPAVRSLSLTKEVEHVSCSNVIPAVWRFEPYGQATVLVHVHGM